MPLLWAVPPFAVRRSPRNGVLLRWLGWTCAGVMLLATIIMFVTAFAA